MAKDINKRLEELNIKIDEPSAPAGSYVPYVISNNLVFIEYLALDMVAKLQAP